MKLPVKKFLSPIIDTKLQVNETERWDQAHQTPYVKRCNCLNLRHGPQCCNRCHLIVPGPKLKNLPAGYG